MTENKKLDIISKKKKNQLWDDSARRDMGRYRARPVPP